MSETPAGAVSRSLLTVVCLVALAWPVAGATQSENDGDSEKARAVVEAAIAALGGDRYVAASSETAKGIFTPFQQGRRGVPIEFVDVFVYPDKNRTEFGRKKGRIVQSNAGESGWKYDGVRESLEDQNDAETAAFLRYVRSHAGNVLRAYWRAPGVTLEYLGREEIAPRDWVEGVAVIYPDGFRTEILFDTKTKLPSLTRYREGSESGAPGTLSETKYHFYLDYGGVKAPRIVDLYKDGVQTAHIVYDSVEFNAPVEAGFFDRPESAKALK